MLLRPFSSLSFFYLSLLILRPLCFCYYLPFLILYLNLHKFVYILSFVSFHRARELFQRFAFTLLDFYFFSFFARRNLSLIFLSAHVHVWVLRWCWYGYGCVCRCARQIFWFDFRIHIFVFFILRLPKLSYIYIKQCRLNLNVECHHCRWWIRICVFVHTNVGCQRLISSISWIRSVLHHIAFIKFRYATFSQLSIKFIDRLSVIWHVNWSNIAFIGKVYLVNAAIKIKSDWKHIYFDDMRLFTRNI